MKGIILSGGSGTRLYPLTTMVNKQLLPVYDKPMVYYPLTTLLNFGIREILLISSPEYIGFYENLLGNGNKWGISIRYKVQEKPEGLAQAMILAEEFLEGQSACLILGDNIFHGNINTYLSDDKRNFGLNVLGSTVFAYEVKDPERYGVVEFDDSAYKKVLSLEEKPKEPKSKYAIPGLYFFDKKASEYAKTLKPSPRGELEIIDLLKMYLERGDLSVATMRKETVWLDAGTPTSLFQASAYIQTIQERQGIMIGCYEEACLKNEFISKERFKQAVETLPKCDYRKYLEGLT